MTNLDNLDEQIKELAGRCCNGLHDFGKECTFVERGKALIAERELKARIDELERLPESTRWISRAGKNINVLDRLKELRKELLDD